MTDSFGRNKKTSQMKNKLHDHTKKHCELLDSDHLKLLN